MCKQMRRAHRFLASHAFYTLTLTSTLAWAIYVGRVHLSQSHTYSFMLWNLLLAWIPYLSSLIFAASTPHQRVRGWLLVPAGTTWLFFFPNAPYLVTDLIHLQYHTGFAGWYDVGMLAIFAWTGILLAVASLNVMKGWVRVVLGSVVSWLFLLGAVGLSGFGIYLGRFQHWNSWDLLLNPGNLFVDVVRLLSDPSGRYRVVGVTGLYAALLLTCYISLTVLSVHGSQATQE